MRIVNRTPFPAGPILFSIRPPQPSLSLVVKGTFALKPGAPAAPLEKQPSLTGEAWRDEDLVKDCLHPGDLAPFKPRPDLLLTGSCYAPGNQATVACPVGFRVGRWTKSLAVIGDRLWMRGLFTSSMTHPISFRKMPLAWTHAFGGAGFVKNPAGRGIDDEVMPEGGKARRLPNIEDRERLITGLSSRPDPAGFGPISSMWSQRVRKVGTYKGRWLKERWPWFPENFDWTFFNAAPEDQQPKDYLRGDEEIGLDNLHPTVPHFLGKLPGLRIRGFLARGSELRRIPMNLDTLLVDTDHATLTLVWRGVIDVASDHPEQLPPALIISEPLAERAASMRMIRPTLEPEPPPPVPEEPPRPPPGPDPAEIETKKMLDQTAKAEADAKATFRGMGVDVDALFSRSAAERGGLPEIAKALAESGQAFANMGVPAPAGLDIALAGFAAGGPIAKAVQEAEAFEKSLVPTPKPDAAMLKAAGGGSGQDLAGLDLSGKDLSGCDFHDAVLAGANLSKANLSGTNLSGAVLAGADLSGAVLRKADLSKADLSGTRLTGADLTGANLKAADGPGAVFDQAALTEVEAQKSLFHGASFAGASFEKAKLAEANLSSANLAGARFPGADLSKAALERASGPGVDMRGAVLAGLKAGDGADFTRGRFSKADAPGSVWEAAKLEGADFSSAKLSRANFASAALTSSTFIAADLKNASFHKAVLVKANLARIDFLRGTFEKADLSGADLRESNCYEAEFLGSVRDGTNLEGADLKMTKLA